MPKYKSAEVGASMRSNGVVEGYAATFDRTPDSYGDVIARGAFARTLQEWRAKSESGLAIPLLYGHKTDSPMFNIGRVTDAYEDDRGLFIKAEFDADNEYAQYARKLAAEGRLYQFSFAYATKDAGDVEIDGHWAWELRDLDLFEVSLVQIPANQNAVITGIKSDDGGLRAGAGAIHSNTFAERMKGIRDGAEQIITAINGLMADEDEQDEADDGQEPENNGEAGNGKSEDLRASEESDADELAAAKANADAILKALEVM